MLIDRALLRREVIKGVAAVLFVIMTLTNYASADNETRSVVTFEALSTILGDVEGAATLVEYVYCDDAGNPNSEYYLVTAYHNIWETDAPTIRVTYRAKDPGLHDISELIYFDDDSYFDTVDFDTVDMAQGNVLCNPVADLAVLKFADNIKEKIVSVLEEKLRNTRARTEAGAIPVVDDFDTWFYPVPLARDTGQRDIVAGTRLIAAGNATYDDSVVRNYSLQTAFSATAAQHALMKQIIRRMTEQRVLPNAANNRVLLMESMSIQKGFSGGPVVAYDSNNNGRLVGIVWGGTPSTDVEPGRFAWAATGMQVVAAIEGFRNHRERREDHQLIDLTAREPSFPRYPYVVGQNTENTYLFSNDKRTLRNWTFVSADQTALNEVFEDRANVRREFVGVTFRDIDFSLARLHNAIFRNCEFVGCQFDGAVLNGATFIRCTNNRQPVSQSNLSPLLSYGVQVFEDNRSILSTSVSGAAEDGARRSFEAYASFPTALHFGLPPAQLASIGLNSILSPDRLRKISVEVNVLKRERESSIGRDHAFYTMNIALGLLDIAMIKLQQKELGESTAIVNQADLEMSALDAADLATPDLRVYRQLLALRMLVQTKLSTTSSESTDPPPKNCFRSCSIIVDPCFFPIRFRSVRGRRFRF